MRPVSSTILLLHLVAALTMGQEDGRSSFRVASADTLPLASLRFERLLHTYSWNADAMLAVEAGPWSASTRQQLRSRFIQSQHAVQQDEYQGGLELRRVLAPTWSLVLKEQSSVVAGPTSLDLAELAQHRVLGGVLLGDHATSSLSGLAGWEWNRQQGRSDAGPSISLSAGTRDVEWEEILLDGRGGWRRSDLGERKPSDADLEVSVRRSFGEAAEYRLTAAVRSQRRDLPTVSTSTSVGGPAGAPGLFRRDEDALVVRNALWVAVAPDLRGSFDAGWTDRRVERSFSGALGISDQLPTTIRQLQLDASGRLVWEPMRGWLQQSTLGFVRGEESHDVFEQEGSNAASADQQRRQARRRSNQSQRVYLSLSSGIPVDDRTDLQATVSSNILRYDTPDTLNTDDRDELILTGGLEIVRRWSQWFSTHLLVDAAMDHLVYLSRFQSANNVTIRTIRLSPLIVWRTPGGFRNALRSEVAASYTVYDFEDVVGGVQSYSYRQALWADSLVVPVGRGVLLEFSGSLRLFERGLLRWKDFRERPERSFKELAWWPRLRLVRWPGISIAVGFRSFRQERTVVRNGVSTYDGAIGSSGPTVDLQVFWRSGSTILISGWRETQRSEARILDSISNLTMHVTTPL